MKSKLKQLLWVCLVDSNTLRNIILEKSGCYKNCRKQNGCHTFVKKMSLMCGVESHESLAEHMLLRKYLLRIMNGVMKMYIYTVIDHN